VKNLKIGARLGIGFAVILSLLVVVALTALVRMQTAGDLTYRLVNTSIKNQRNVAEWAKLIELNSARIETVFIANDPAVYADMAQRMKAVSARSTELQNAIESSLRKEAVKEQFKVVKQERVGYLAARDALFKAKLAGEHEQAATIYRERMLPHTASFQEVVAKLAAALRPGGTIVIHEYLHYESMTVLPDDGSIAAFTRQVVDDWRASGGEPNVGLCLPGLLLEIIAEKV